MSQIYWDSVKRCSVRTPRCERRQAAAVLCRQLCVGDTGSATPARDAGSAMSKRVAANLHWLPSPEKSDEKAFHFDDTKSDFLGEGLGVRENPQKSACVCLAVAMPR